MNSPVVRSIIALLLLAGASCKKSTPPAPGATTPPAAHVPGTPHTDEVLTAWRNAGLAPEGFVSIQPTSYGATYCEHGTVGAVDTVVCEYASDEALTAGIQQVKEGWTRVDVHTGVILQAKRTTMAVVDRERREPSGKTISQMVKAFRKLLPEPAQ
jgi:hypothetical protein